MKKIFVVMVLLVSQAFFVPESAQCASIIMEGSRDSLLPAPDCGETQETGNGGSGRD